MSMQLQSKVLIVVLEKIEPSTVIKNEPPESEIVEIGIDDILDSSDQESIADIKDMHDLSEDLIKSETISEYILENNQLESMETQIGIDDILDSSDEESIPDIKDIEIVLHELSEDLIKSETVSENILVNNHTESMETQETQIFVKTENNPVIETENITQSENTSDGNVNRGTGRELIKVQGSNEHFNAFGNQTDKQLVLDCSKNLSVISLRSRKAKQQSGNTDFSECDKPIETTSYEKLEKDKKKRKVIKVPMPIEPHESTTLAKAKHACNKNKSTHKQNTKSVEAHEYTSLAKDRHVCNHCQYAFNRLNNLKLHIKRMHKEANTMYQCPYCPYKSKWKHDIIKLHITLKHKDTKDIEWFQCNLCEVKFKLKKYLTQHMKVHLKHKQIQDGLDLRRYHCNNCDYKTDDHHKLKRHNLVHLKPEEIEYFCCYHCSYKSKLKFVLKNHIFRQHFKTVKQGKRHHCDKCDYKTYQSANLKRHELTHLKPEEIQYFYCYHCSYKFKEKGSLKRHIFTHHFKNVRRGKRHHCDKCDYKTYASTALKNRTLTHLKPEKDQYFYCYHCSYKAKQKGYRKEHIFIHFKKEQVKFDCYICNFMTPNQSSNILRSIPKYKTNPKLMKKPSILVIFESFSPYIFN